MDSFDIGEDEEGEEKEERDERRPRFVEREGLNFQNMLGYYSQRFADVQTYQDRAYILLFIINAAFPLSEIDPPKHKNQKEYIRLYYADRYEEENISLVDVRIKSELVEIEDFKRRHYMNELFQCFRQVMDKLYQEGVIEYKRFKEPNVYQAEQGGGVRVDSTR